MVGVNCFLIAVILWLGTSVTEGSKKEDHQRLLEKEAAWKQYLEEEMNETTNVVQSGLASQGKMEESVQKNIERIQKMQSYLLERMENVGISLEELKDGKVTVQINTNDIGLLQQELSHIQSNTDAISQLRQELARIQNQCGVDNNGGRNNNRMWPWMAAVYFVYLKEYNHLCDGTVIHRKFILTSDWCAEKWSNDSYIVKLGFSDEKNDNHVQEHKVRKFHRHPQFKSLPNDNFDYGIALLELEKPISYDQYVSPVCLPPAEKQNSPFYKPYSTVKGVDLHEYINSTSRNASTYIYDLTIQPHDECRRKLREKDLEKYYPSPELSFCAKTPFPYVCPRRGSPMLQSFIARDGTRRWVQVGLRSGGYDCEYSFSPRLEHLRPWVEKTIADSSKP